MITQKLIRNDIKPIQLGGDLLQWQDWMDEYKVSHLPVVEGNTFLGLISEEMLLNATDEVLTEQLAHGAMKYASIGYDKHLFDAINLFNEFRVSMLPVVDDALNYLGYLFPEDIVVALGGMISSKIPGAILVLEVNQYDYHFSQIAQIVEANDARILAFYITSSPNSAVLELTLRINRTDLSPIVQTLQRYKYTIAATYHESEHEVDLKERFDQFMKYLNI